MEDLLREYFDEMVVYKDLKKSNFFASLGLPAFLRDWVLRKFEDDKGSYDVDTSRFNNYTKRLDDKYITKMTNEVNEKYDVSVSMQYNDYYKYIFK